MRDVENDLLYRQLLVSLNLTYMKWILHLVPVKIIILKSSYNWFKIDILRLLRPRTAIFIIQPCSPQRLYIHNVKLKLCAKRVLPFREWFWMVVKQKMKKNLNGTRVPPPSWQKPLKISIVFLEYFPKKKCSIAQFNFWSMLAGWCRCWFIKIILIRLMLILKLLIMLKHPMPGPDVPLAMCQLCTAGNFSTYRKPCQLHTILLGMPLSIRQIDGSWVRRIRDKLK